MKSVILPIISSVLLASCAASNDTFEEKQVLGIIPNNIKIVDNDRFTNKGRSISYEENGFYESFPRSKNPGITKVEGVSLIRKTNTNKNTVRVNVNPVTGSLNRDTGAFQYVDANYKLVDDDGFTNDERGVASDGTATIQEYHLETGVPYKYMSVYNMNIAYGNDYQQDEIIGVFGNPTRKAELEATGSATYSGRSMIGYENTSFEDGTERSNARGLSTVSADFANGTVDVELHDLAWQDVLRTPIPNGAFDKMRVTDLKIQGSTFTGGTGEYIKDDKVIDVIGENASSIVAGNFYGAKNLSTGTRGPAEVGGVGFDYGDDGKVSVAYTAD